MKRNTIVALSTPAGNGAIAVIRLSGNEAIACADAVFTPHSGKKLMDLPSHTVHLGYFKNAEKIIDECLATIFKGKRSYTGEPTVEFSCHGSVYIQQEIINACLQNGCELAQPGEFTLRAFLNGKMDLSQAEAVADLIASDSEAAHQIALRQMRGGFTSEIHQLRQELLNFASLIELELDFSEEDVEFADRNKFRELVFKIQKTISRLIDSFAVGNVIKNGIPVAIIGQPNAGKSTLLNALLNEDRAIVSEIAGTTRDTIEDEINIGGIAFRFIDTAGIRNTDDHIESLGIQKAFEKAKQAQIVIYLVDSANYKNNTAAYILEIEKIKNRFPQKPIVVVFNKIDELSYDEIQGIMSSIVDVSGIHFETISAKNGKGIEKLQNHLLSFVNTGVLQNNDTIVTNSRHYEALLRAQKEINNVQEGLDTGISGDLLAIDIRQALYYFGEITGEVTNDELLGNIFANFCIGK